MKSSTITMNVLAVVVAFTASIGQAAVVSNVVNTDFTSSSVTFGYGPVFTLSDNRSGFPSPVSINTGADAAITSLSLFGPTVPTSYFDPARSPLVFNDNFYQYSAFNSPAVIDYSFQPTFIGLRVSLDDGFHYGYAQFQGTFLKAYAFESVAGVGIEAGALAPVPEPESYALLLAGLSLMGFVARKKIRA